jgi:two-component system, response regulator
MIERKSATILLAEDDPDDRLLTQDAFRESRIADTLQCVEDGEALLDYLHRRGRYRDALRPDLILLDLNMPRMDGREALRVIKADPALRRIPVVVLTTSREEGDVARSYDLGVNSFIVKPASYQALVDLVRTLSRYWFDVVKRTPAGSEA